MVGKPECYICIILWVIKLVSLKSTFTFPFSTLQSVAGTLKNRVCFPACSPLVPALRTHERKVKAEEKEEGFAVFTVLADSCGFWDVLTFTTPTPPLGITNNSRQHQVYTA